MRWLSIVFFALGVLGCPSRSDTRPLPSKVCKKFGDQCEFSPGKLGACMTSDPCTHGDCLFCQSQH